MKGRSACRIRGGCLRVEGEDEVAPVGSSDKWTEVEVNLFHHWIFGTGFKLSLASQDGAPPWRKWRFATGAPHTLTLSLHESTASNPGGSDPDEGRLMTSPLIDVGIGWHLRGGNNLLVYGISEGMRRIWGRRRLWCRSFGCVCGNSRFRQVILCDEASSIKP